MVEMLGDNPIKVPPPNLAGLDGGTSHVNWSVLVRPSFSGNHECGEG